MGYARRELYKSSYSGTVGDEIEKDYLFIEKVRIDYRNPSAHRGEMDETSATSCMGYVFDIYHMGDRPETIMTYYIAARDKIVSADGEIQQVVRIKGYDKA